MNDLPLERSQVEAYIQEQFRIYCQVAPAPNTLAFFTQSVLSKKLTLKTARARIQKLGESQLVAQQLYSRSQNATPSVSASLPFPSSAPSTPSLSSVSPSASLPFLSSTPTISSPSLPPTQFSSEGSVSRTQPFSPSSAWTREEIQRLEDAVDLFGDDEIESIASHVETRSIQEISQYLPTFLEEKRNQAMKRTLSAQRQRPAPNPTPRPTVPFSSLTPVSNTSGPNALTPQKFNPYAAFSAPSPINFTQASSSLVGSPSLREAPAEPMSAPEFAAAPPSSTPTLKKPPEPVNEDWKALFEGTVNRPEDSSPKSGLPTSTLPTTPNVPNPTPGDVPSLSFSSPQTTVSPPSTQAGTPRVEDEWKSLFEGTVDQPNATSTPAMPNVSGPAPTQKKSSGEKGASGQRDYQVLFDAEANSLKSRKFTVSADCKYDPETVKEYVWELYRVHTGAKPDPALYSWHVQSILNGSYTLLQAELSIKHSKEAKQYAQKQQAQKTKIVEYVKELNRVFLKRAPTPEEIEYYVGKILSKESTFQDIEDEVKMKSLTDDSSDMHLPSVPKGT